MDTIIEQFSDLTFGEIKADVSYDCGKLGSSTGLSFLMKCVLTNDVNNVKSYIKSCSYTNIYVSKKESTNNVRVILNRKNDKGHCALMMAIANDVNIEITKELIDNGADINCTYDGNTLLNFAILNNNCEVIKLLLDVGMDVNKHDIKKNSPLQFAVCGSAKFEVIKLLIDSGADVNKGDVNGRSIITIVCANVGLAMNDYGYEILMYILNKNYGSSHGALYKLLMKSVVATKYLDIFPLYLSKITKPKDVNIKNIIECITFNNNIKFKGHHIELISEFCETHKITSFK